MAKKKTAKKKATKKAVTTKKRSQAQKKAGNSLVANINQRKKAGKSRPKSKSTISKTAYKKMQASWKAD